MTELQAGKGVFLLGHSLGGGIATYYLLDHQAEFKGAILSAPTVKVGEGISSATITMSKILSRIAPKMGVLALDISGLSRDPKVVDAIVNDPLIFHGKTPARLGAEMLSAMMRITEEAGKITLPVLIIQGGEDILVEPSGAQMLFDLINSQDKTLKIYDGMYHEIFNEIDCDRVFKDVENWLSSQMAG